MNPNLQATDVTEQAVLNALASNKSYEQIAAEHGRSRGWVYSIAVKHGARKHEARISERAHDRKRRQAEFLKEVMDATTQSDVLDFLDGIPDGVVDLMCFSPPYNVGKRYGGGTGSADTISMTYWLGWMLMVISACYQKLSPGGVLFLQVGSTHAREGDAPWPIDAMLFNHLVSMGMTFNSRVVWTVPHGLTPKRRLAERHETALVMSKGPIRVFNPTPARTATKEPAKRFFKGPNRGEISSHPFGSHPSNVWTDIPNVGHNNPEKTGHPAQFPEALARRAVLLYTLAGDLVCDPFSGSGSTQAVCKRTGRGFIGADLFYGELRQARLAKVSPDLVSPLPGVTDASVAVWQAEALRIDVPATKADPDSIKHEHHLLQLDLLAEPLRDAA